MAQFMRYFIRWFKVKYLVKSLEKFRIVWQYFSLLWLAVRSVCFTPLVRIPLNIASLEDRNKPSKVGYENFTRIYPTEANFGK